MMDYNIEMLDERPICQNQARKVYLRYNCFLPVLKELSPLPYHRSAVPVLVALSAAELEGLWLVQSTKVSATGGTQ